MAGPAETAPLFVPRTVTRAEGAASRIARRALGPMRGLGGRVLSFADRLISGWTGGWIGGEAGEGGAEDRPTAAALRMAPAGLTVPEPWYELDEPETETDGPQHRAPAARTATPRTLLAGAPDRAPAGSPDARGAGSAGPPAPERDPAVSGERRAAEWLGLTRTETRPAIERRPVPSPLVRPLAHAGWVDERLGAAREPGSAARAASYVFVAPPAEATEPRGVRPLASAGPAAPRAVAGEERVRESEAPPRPSAETGSRSAPSSTITSSSPVVPAVALPGSSPASAASPSPASGASSSAALPGISPLAVPGKVGAATASGFGVAARLPSAARPSALPSLGLPAGLAPIVGPLVATTSRLARFVGQLVGARTARETAPLPLEATGGEAAPPAAASRVPRVEYVRGLEPSGERSGAERGVAGASRAPVRGGNPPTPAAAASEIAIGSQAAAGSTVRATAPATDGREREGRVANGPARETGSSYAVSSSSMGGAAERDPAVQSDSRAGSLRPGSIALRAEQLGGLVDARLAAAFGEELPPARREGAGPLVPLLPASDPAERETERPRARGAAATARFVDGLVGVDVARATSPRPVIVAPTGEPLRSEPRAGVARELIVPSANPAAAVTADAAGRKPGAAAASGERRGGATSAHEPSGSRAIGGAGAMAAGLVAAVDAGSASARADGAGAGADRGILRRRADAPESVFLEGAEPDRSAPGRAARRAHSDGLRPGGLGVRAEELAGQVGVKAAGLSVDFVDPAGLSALAAAGAPSELAWWPSTDGTAPTADPAEPAGGPTAGRASQSTRPLSGDEWALVATFPTAATAGQVAAARRAASLLGGREASLLGSREASLRAGQAPAQPLLAGVGGSHNWGSTLASTARADRARMGGADPAILDAAFASLAGGEPREGAGPGEAFGARGAAGELPRDYVVPTVVAADRARLPGGRMPRGSFTWPRGAREKMGAEPSGAQADAVGERAAAGEPPWRSAVRPMVAGGDAEAAPGAGASAGGLSVVAPLLEVIRGGHPDRESGAESFRRASEPQPLVSGSPSGEAAAQLVQAAQRLSPSSASSGASNDASNNDRVTLSDLTLISIASANQQVAASETGSGPTAAASRPASPSGSSHGAEQHAAGPSGEDIEHLAREVYDELKRMVEIARERSGDPWES